MINHGNSRSFNKHSDLVIKTMNKDNCYSHLFQWTTTFVVGLHIVIILHKPWLLTWKEQSFVLGWFYNKRANKHHHESGYAHDRQSIDHLWSHQNATVHWHLQYSHQLPKTSHSHGHGQHQGVLLFWINTCWSYGCLWLPCWRIF